MNNTPIDQQFPLSYNDYAAFDATSLKSLMQNRLNQNGTFTDQVFEGSNFNNILDVIAYSYNVLLYYLNQTSNESLFSSSQIYENMNKIVKLINYKPLGQSTSILTYEAVASEGLDTGVYTIPRFSYFTINDVNFTFNKDLTFVKSLTGSEDLAELYETSLLFQGEFVEYPLYIATGENYEEVTIVSVDEDGNNDVIDNNNIFIFVRDGSGRWKEWSRVESIYLQNGASEVFEVRFNENQRYSIKFGNNVTGKRLTGGNLVAIYFLKSDKERGNVDVNTLNENQLFLYNTDRYNAIMADIRGSNIRTITTEEANNINFSNRNASVPYTDVENTSQIRANAPNAFKRQSRLVTVADFESYIYQNLSNLIVDVKVVNNWDYLEHYIGYFYKMGIDNPMLDSRVLYNQINFASSCNFNNLYAYVIPKTLASNNFSYDRAFLNLGLKDYIASKIKDIKLSTVDLIFNDPVYIYTGFGSASQEEILNNKLSKSIADETKLIVVKSSNNYVGKNEIKEKIKNLILNYFSFKNSKLGQTIELDILTKDIYSIQGIEEIYTYRNNIITPGLNFLMYNVAYGESNEDITLVNQTIKLPYFKIAYWGNVSKILDQIEIIDSTVTT